MILKIRNLPGSSWNRALWLLHLRNTDNSRPNTSLSSQSTRCFIDVRPQVILSSNRSLIIATSRPSHKHNSRRCRGRLREIGHLRRCIGNRCMSSYQVFTHLQRHHNRNHRLSYLLQQGIRSSLYSGIGRQVLCPVTIPGLPRIRASTSIDLRFRLRPLSNL